MSEKFFLFFLLVVAGNVSAEQQQLNCTEERRFEIDRVVNRILAFGPDGRTFPTNDDELKGFCSDTNRMIKSVVDYFKECEPRHRQDLANVFAYSLKHVVRTLCQKRKTKKVKDFFKVAPCLNKFIKEDNCISGFAKEGRPVIVADIGNEKLKHICCAENRAMKCVDDWLVSHECSRDYRELLNDYVHGVFDNLINFMCGEFNDDSDRCENIKPLPVLREWQLKRLKPFKSFMFIIMDVLDSLDGKN